MCSCACAYVCQPVVNPLQVCWARATAVGTFLLGFSASYCPGRHSLSARLRVNDNTGTDTQKNPNLIQSEAVGWDWVPCCDILGGDSQDTGTNYTCPHPLLSVVYCHFLLFISLLLPVSLFSSLRYLLLLKPMNHMSHVLFLISLDEVSCTSLFHSSAS